MMVSISLFLIIVLYCMAIAIALMRDKKVNPDKFSGVKITSYFAMIELFVMLWFALRPDAIKNIIFPQVAAEYRDYFLVVYAYAFSLIVYVFVILGVISGSYSKNKLPLIAGRYVFGFMSMRRFTGWHGASFLYSMGLFSYFCFLQQIGGLSNLWSDISQRVLLTAGLGYYQSLYVLLITVSTAFLYVEFFHKRKFILFLICSLSFFILASLGQRAPAAVMVFILIIVHHYKIKPIKQLITKKLFIVISVVLLFMYLSVQLRPSSEEVDVTTRIERDVIHRLGTIERQIVVAGYFETHEYWGTGLYASLIYAMIPRGLFPEKPPVDTGVYLNDIRQGGSLTPPVPVEDLAPSSWPDGYLAGYMSFGIIGLICLSFLSGYFYGLVYRLTRMMNYSIVSIVFYSLIGFMGVNPLCPFGITRIMILLLFFIVLGFFSRISFNRA